MMDSVKNPKKILIFLALAYLSAFIFEETPRIIFIEIFKDPGTVHIWEVPGALTFVPLWYTVIFLTAYFIFIEQPVKYAVLFGIIFGILAETFVFKKMNEVSFFLFILLYGGMFYMPFKLIKRFE